MTPLNYANTSVLIADDFSNFRSTVNSMLQSLGVQDVESAANSQEAIECCQRRSFDLILCDYNLGRGRTGQHVLEELRHRKLISHNTVFIIVSAEASRNIVMSAYDCQPDDYLMKPINTKTLSQRMTRLLAQRKVFSPVYKALDKGDVSTAIDLLIDISLEENRNALAAQKMLGELFIEQGMLDNAEKLYTKALEVRQLDWARLGLAKVKQAKGELEIAGAWLEKIVEENPLYLPAYDSLVTNWEKIGENDELQFAAQKAVDISPMSILRQKKLGEVAQINNDINTCVEALRKTIRLGEHSCHGNAENHFTFARVVALGMERNLDLDPSLNDEAMLYLKSANEWFNLDASQSAQALMLESRVLAASGNTEKAKDVMERAGAKLETQEVTLEVQLDHVSMLISLGREEEAEALLKSLQELHKDDEQALKKLDIYLNEPASEENRSLVASINREGINFYNQNLYDEALSCFERARKLFPKHIGIQLNIVQALIGKMKKGDADRLVANECYASLELVSSLIDTNNPQYGRYLKLREMAFSQAEFL